MEEIPDYTVDTKHKPEVKLQLCTSFPSENKKRIDYVIYYCNKNDDDDLEEKNLARESFFKEVREEGIEIREIKYDIDDETHIIKLLHCPKKRLFDEAEKMKLEMILKINVKPRIEEDQKIRTAFYHRVKKAMKPMFHDVSDETMTARYEHALKFFFSATQENEPFSTTIRSLLTENILNNIDFLLKKASKKKDWKRFFNRKNSDEKIEREAETIEEKEIGLPFMMYKNYFDDGFILHDLTYDSKFNKKLEGLLTNSNIFSNNNENEYFKKCISTKPESLKIDMRDELRKRWSSLRNFFKFQPMNLIRDYFGEKIGFYFAWTGMFVTTLLLPTLIGFIFFWVGFDYSLKEESKRIVNEKLLNQTETLTTNLKDIERIFAKSFDNFLVPFFAVIICLWGSYFLELNKRRTAELAFNWNVSGFEKHEQDLPSYIKRRTEIKKILGEKGTFIKFIYLNEKIFKRILSFSVLFLMISISLMQVASIILYRVYIKVIAFPEDELVKSLLGDGVSTIITSVFIMLMNYIYSKICVITTSWENHRTATQFYDNLILKEFAFQFVNGYAPLFYLAFFRLIDHPNGLFGLGPQYQDKCLDDDCMSLLSLQVALMLIIKPLPSFFLTIIWPFIKLLYTKFSNRKKGDQISPNDEQFRANLEMSSYRKQLREKCVRAYVLSEKNKSLSDTTITGEYANKTLIFGYLMLFGCSFTLGPLIFLLVNMIDLRVDASRLLWLFRRPVGHRAQDIGTWLTICNFLNMIGIISNGLIIAFTSNWSDSFLNDSTADRLTFFVIFEHVIFFLWFLIKKMIPDMPSKVKRKIREENNFVDELISIAKRNFFMAQNKTQEELSDVASQIIDFKNDMIDGVKSGYNELKDAMHSYSDNERNSEYIPHTPRFRKSKSYKDTVRVTNENEGSDEDINKLPDINSARNRNRKKKSSKKGKLIPLKGSNSYNELSERSKRDELDERLDEIKNYDERIKYDEKDERYNERWSKET